MSPHHNGSDLLLRSASMRCESRKQWVEFPVTFIFLRLWQILVHEDDKGSVKYSIGTAGPKHFISTASRYPWASAFSVSSKGNWAVILASACLWLLKWTWLWDEQLRQPWKERASAGVTGSVHFHSSVSRSFSAGGNWGHFTSASIFMKGNKIRSSLDWACNCFPFEELSPWSLHLVQEDEVCFDTNIQGSDPIPTIGFSDSDFLLDHKSTKISNSVVKANFW